MIGCRFEAVAGGCLVEQRIDYTLETAGEFYIVEDVPARIKEAREVQGWKGSPAARVFPTSPADGYGEAAYLVPGHQVAPAHRRFAFDA